MYYSSRCPLLAVLCSSVLTGVLMTMSLPPVEFWAAAAAARRSAVARPLNIVDKDSVLFLGERKGDECEEEDETEEYE